MKDNILRYKGYTTRVEYSCEDGVLHGRIEGISDLVNFESDSTSPVAVEAAFREAVDDYIALCEDVGKSPDKEYKGSFNVRIDPDLHRRLDQSAYQEGISMNQMLERSVKWYFDHKDWQKAGGRTLSADYNALSQARDSWAAFNPQIQSRLAPIKDGMLANLNNKRRPLQ